MNKKLISFAVMAGLASTASAVNVNPDGLGQVLLFPYYTTNGGKVSALTVVNTTNDAKAVKIRFSEGVNTWEVLDFNLYLSPYDTWVAGIAQNTSGDAVIFSDDTSCISPKQLGSYSAGGQAFRSGNITNHGTGGNTAEPTSVATSDRLKEGHIELIEMGVLDNSSTNKVFVNNTQTLAGTVTHSNGTPVDCTEVATDMWATSGSNGWEANSTNLMHSPTGGLFGSIDIVDVSKGIGRSYDAVAIDGFFDTSKNNGVAHSRPGNSFPNLNGDMLTTANLSSLQNVGSTQSIVFNNGAQVTSNWVTPIDALSAALSVNTISNIYYIGDDLGAATDWVVSFPTKHYYVNEETASATDGQYGQACVDDDDKDLTAIAPFGSTANTTTGLDCTTTSNGTDSFGVKIEVKVYDREEDTFTPELDFSPSTTPTDNLSYEVNIIEFDDSRDVLDSVLANSIQGVNYTGGWANLRFSGGNSMTSTEGHVYSGLPAIGFSAYEATNASTLANYSMIYQHKYTRNIS